MIEILLETTAMILAALGGACIGRITSGMRRFWIPGFLVPMLVLASVLLRWCLPSLEFIRPFDLIFAGRNEFTFTAIACTTILSALTARLTDRRQKKLLGFLIIALTAYFSIPFVMPAVTYSSFAKQRSIISRDTVNCKQSTDYTCGPAAMTTALRKLGLKAEEGELAILSRSTWMFGTPGDMLARAVNRRYGRLGYRAEYRRFSDPAEISKHLPLVAKIRFSALDDHYVCILSMNKSTVTIADPSNGISDIPLRQFLHDWRWCGISVRF